jgi:uncharacterized protein with GYD domain
VSEVTIGREYIGASPGARGAGSVESAARSRTRAQEDIMPKFLVEAAYTAEGLRGLQKDKASGRRDAVVKAVTGLEGKVEAFYFAMGKRDVVVIVELPDAVSAAALSLAVSASGFARIATTTLLGVEEIDRALSKKLNWRAPGAQ